MSTEPFIGEIKIFGFYFAPKYHALCNGQILNIASNTALFSLLGTTYGGNGTTTFGLPDLQGRMAVGQGTNQQSGGQFPMGQKAGNVSATLQVANLPPHIHTLNNMSVRVQSNSNNGGENAPSMNFPGINNSVGIYAASAGNSEYMGPNAVQISGQTDPSGSGFPFSIANPYLVMNYSIATNGIFPSRN